MERFASLATKIALAGALLGVGTVSHAASNTLNMYLVPVSPLNAVYHPGDTILFAALIDIPATGPRPITLNLGPTIAFDPNVYDNNGVSAAEDQSAYPPKPTVKLWDLVPPDAFGMTDTGPDGTAASALPTFQCAMGHTKQTTQPGNKVTTIPAGTYTTTTFAFPVLATASSGPTTVYLPSAFGFGGRLHEFLGNTDAAGTNDEVLAFPDDGVSKFSKLTYNISSGGGATPSPSSLLIMAIGAIPIAGTVRGRRAK